MERAKDWRSYGSQAPMAAEERASREVRESLDLYCPGQASARQRASIVTSVDGSQGHAVRHASFCAGRSIEGAPRGQE